MTFDSGSQGQLAMVIYEWGDMAYLGKVTSTANDMPVSAPSLASATHAHLATRSRRHTSAHPTLSKVASVITRSWATSSLTFRRTSQ